MDPSALSNSIAALRSSIKDLESSSSFWESLLYVFVALVVIGVILEVGVVVWEYRESREEFHRGTIRSPQKPSKRKLSFELLGAVLVALGVAGEFVIGVKAGSIQTALRIKNGELILLLEGVSSAALNEAARLDAHVSPRSLSTDRQRAIAMALGRFSGHRVMVSSYGLDGEGDALGAQIIGVLRTVLGDKNVLDARSSILSTGRFERGVHVRGPTTEREFASSLGAALSMIGKLQTFVNDPGPDFVGFDGGGERFPAGTAFVTVMVGIKPVPILPVP